MKITNNDIDKIEVIGDRILIKPSTAKSSTKSGLILPPGIQEKENIQSGYVIKVGPGYPIPSNEIDEPWKPNTSTINYIPLQVQEGDLAIFLQNSAFEIQFNNNKYFVLPQAAVLLVIKDQFDLD